MKICDTHGWFLKVAVLWGIKNKILKWTKKRYYYLIFPSNDYKINNYTLELEVNQLRIKKWFTSDLKSKILEA